MRWLELTVQAPGEYAETLASVFARYADGRVAVEEAGGYNPDEGETRPPPDSMMTVRAYLALDGTTEDRRNHIDLGVRLISHVYPLAEIEERVIDEEQWRIQFFEPIRIGRRLVVAPLDSAPELKADDVLIPLEPGLAFGTGQHPTTRMCLALLEERICPGFRVLDVGCGSGILSIAALGLGADSVVAVDVEADAVKASRKNLQAADMLDRVTLVEGALPHPSAPAEDFDVVVANISSTVLIQLADELRRPLRRGGVLIGSGFILDRREPVVEALTSAALRTVDTTLQGDWVAVTMERG